MARHPLHGVGQGNRRVLTALAADPPQSELRVDIADVERDDRRSDSFESADPTPSSVHGFSSGNAAKPVDNLSGRGYFPAQLSDVRNISNTRHRSLVLLSSGR